MTSSLPSFIGSLRGWPAQRAALEDFVRAYFTGDVDALIDFALETRLYSARQTRETIRWRIERTVARLKLNLGGDGK